MKNTFSSCRYELLLGQRLFSSLSSRRDVANQLSGREMLPWEDPARQHELNKMKGLKRSVLRCLSRNPRHRPTSDLLLKRCVHILSSACITPRRTLCCIA
jgi:hypothetical protein